MGSSVESVRRPVMIHKDCPPTRQASPDRFRSFAIPEVSVTVITRPIMIPCDTHSHQEHEFFIPFTPIPEVKAEHRVLETRHNQLIPFTSGQVHGMTRAMKGRFLCLNLARWFVEELAESVFGEDGVTFRNDAIPYTALLQRLLSSFVEEAQGEEPGYLLALQGMSLQIGLDVLRRARTNLPVATYTKDYSEDRALGRAIDYMIASGSDASLEGAADAANLSRFHFIRVFKRKMGVTPWEYLTSVRVQQACALMKKERLTITQIAHECGFKNSSYFATVFRRVMGATPTEYRSSVLSSGEEEAASDTE